MDLNELNEIETMAFEVLKDTSKEGRYSDVKTILTLIKQVHELISASQVTPDNRPLTTG